MCKEIREASLGRYFGILQGEGRDEEMIILIYPCTAGGGGVQRVVTFVRGCRKSHTIHERINREVVTEDDGRAVSIKTDHKNTEPPVAECPR